MDLNKIKSAIIALDDAAVKNLVQKALDEKVKPEQILESGLIPGMAEVGRLFSRKEYFVPEILVAAEAFYAGFNLIDPLLKKTAGRRREKVMIAVVEGDIHDIGKNIVKVMVEAAGYRVLDLGKDVPTAKLLESAAREKPSILCLSSLMTTTMVRMPEIINRLGEMNLRDKIKVIIGGAPVTEEYADQIGADGYAVDAAAAVRLIDDLANEP
jgi:corrinoid protein of di/trimethylamine methyltransferase